LESENAQKKPTSGDADTINKYPVINSYVVIDNTKQTFPNAMFVELLKAVLGRGAHFRFQANGSSMLPFIRDGDLITISPTPIRLHLGDVVAFVHQDNNRLTVHRVIQLNRYGYQIQGDNVSGSDGYVSHAHILGRITHVDRHGQHIRLGFGPERVVIAFLSKRRWIAPLFVSMRRFFHKH
jgi:signal peptidase I